MEKLNKTLKNNEKAITLIALVITIIVLLILAGISISMLSGDNSILQKTTEAKTNTERKSVIELAQTDILGQIAENKGENISETQLKTILNKYFEEISEDLPEDLSETTITLNTKEVYGGYTNIALRDIYNGKLKIEPQPIINYGEKTEETIEGGDDITIGIEKFKVLKNENGIIIAIPYYNITLNILDPVQSSSAEKIAFTNTRYWSSGGQNIDMTDNRNNIQQYILAYSKKLSELTDGKVTAEIGRYSGDYGLISYSGKTDGNSRKWLNPSGSGRFWIGTSRGSDESELYFIDTSGFFSWEGYNYPRI